MKPSLLCRLPVAVALLLLPIQFAIGQGALTPPGAPSPSMRSLVQIEPRTPVGGAGLTISAPGSYYLTADLNGNGAVPGLIIAGSNISVDLNGFSVARTVNVGSEPGIVIQSGTANVHVRNGRIRSWGGDGVQVLGSAASHTFEDLELISNGGHGLVAGDEARVRRCLAQYQTGDGIRTGFRSRVEDCRASDNGVSGIRVGVDSTILRSNGSRSGQAGLYLGERSQALECVAGSNASHGIFGVDHCLVRDCLVTLNGDAGIRIPGLGRVESCRLQGNALHGVHCGDRSSLTDCTSDGVTGGASTHGFRAGLNSVYRRCTSTGAGGAGFLVAAGSVLTECSANANTDGFVVGNGCQLHLCTASFNGGTGITFGSNNQLTALQLGQNALHGLSTTGSGNRVEGCFAYFNGGHGLLITAPGVYNQVLRNTISQNSAGNFNTTGPQILAPSVTSGIDPNLAHPHGNIDY